MSKELNLLNKCKLRGKQNLQVVALSVVSLNRQQVAARIPHLMKREKKKYSNQGNGCPGNSDLSPLFCQSERTGCQSAQSVLSPPPPQILRWKSSTECEPFVFSLLQSQVIYGAISPAKRARAYSFASGLAWLIFMPCNLQKWRFSA